MNAWRKNKNDNLHQCITKMYWLYAYNSMMIQNLEMMIREITAWITDRILFILHTIIEVDLFYSKIITQAIPLIFSFESLVVL